MAASVEAKKKIGWEKKANKMYAAHSSVVKIGNKLGARSCLMHWKAVWSELALQPSGPPGKSIFFTWCFAVL